MRGSYFLGVDGGGTKTEFVLIDRTGAVVAQYQGTSSYYLQIGLEGLNHLLNEGVAAVLAQTAATTADIVYAFFGLPAHGEDSEVQPLLDVLPEAVLGHRRYLCGNDMICGWAGSFGTADGINIVAGTGSIGYGERLGRKVRAGGWGETFSDEGSAHWIAIEGLNLFSRMSDGRLPRGPLHRIFREAFGLAADLDICGRLMGQEPMPRDKVAALSRLVSAACEAGDAEALRIFTRAGEELAGIAASIARQLGFEDGEVVRVSYSGGVFATGDLILAPFRASLASRLPAVQLETPRFAPSYGAALYAARLAGEPIGRI